MSDQETSSSPFETIRHTTDDGEEYWSARELAEVLGYAKWANFVPTINDAKKACENSEQAVSDHFLETRKMVSLGSGSQHAVGDFHFSRYACCLVVQNADPASYCSARADVLCRPHAQCGAGGRGCFAGA